MFVEHKEALEVTEVPVKVMKLSEAIRIGAKMGPQIRGQYILENASCAFGAAALAMGGDSDFDLFILAGKLHSAEPLAFACKYKITIAKANDRGWTREEIADALEQLGY